MLQAPAVDAAALAAALRDEYNLMVAAISFLPLGADAHTAVYRVATEDNTIYSLKLRSSNFDEASVGVPRFLRDTGMQEVIPPLPARSGRLWASLPPFRLILSPFIEGRDAHERKLTDAQWVNFGSALKRLHTAVIPADLTRDTLREDFSARWCESVRGYLTRFDRDACDEPLAAFLNSRSAETLKMLDRADKLACDLKQQDLPYVLCHGDVHGWNLLVGDDGSLYIVDWDTLVFAPVERDLMFIGAGLGDTGRTPQEEEALFYYGYGLVKVSRAAISYYRYERISEDIAAYCYEVFLSTASSADRRQALENVMSNFRPGGTVVRAEEADDATSG